MQMYVSGWKGQGLEDGNVCGSRPELGNWEE